MYINESKEHQYSFQHDWFVVPKLDENNIMVKIANSVDWVSLSNKLSKFYSPFKGRPAKPSRAKVSLLILKHLYQLSDVNVVNFLQQNIYAQYLCDVSLKEAKEFINPSTLTKFRKQVGAEGSKLIEEELFNVLKKNKLLKGKKLITDTTVVPSPIAYPTDISLLEKVRRRAVKLLDEAKQYGAKTYRTYKRIAGKTFISYQKVRRHTIRQRKKIQKKLIQFSQRNIKQLKEASKIVAEKAKNSCQTAREKFSQRVQEFLEIAEEIVTQQKNIYKGKPVKERIVSTWATHIRPMVRGKYPVDVEFGPKVLFNLKNKFLFVEDLHFNNINDSNLLIPAIGAYQERFGHLPTQISTDRGFDSPQNREYCRSIGIKKVAIEKRGKSPPRKSKSPAFLKRLRKQRCAIEAKISLAKRRFGLNRINYRIPGGEEIWIRLGLIAMNLKIAFSPG